MDSNHNYHWGATSEIIQSIIRRRDNSPETQKLVDRRTEIVKPGTMRIKRDSHGGEHWTPRRPDANGRKRSRRNRFTTNRPKQKEKTNREHGSDKQRNRKLKHTENGFRQRNNHLDQPDRHTIPGNRYTERSVTNRYKLSNTYKSIR